MKYIIYMFIFIGILYVKSPYELRQKCDNGDSKSCYNLGDIYYEGQMPTQEFLQNYKIAAELYKKACDGRYAVGCIDLGIMYSSNGGYGLQQDYKIAIELFEKACDLGDALGCYRLASMMRTLEIEENAEIDYEMMIELFKKACSGGYTKSCYEVGLIHVLEMQDYKIASEFFEKACSGGEALGCFNLAIMYEEGEGISQNLSKAKEFYNRACNLGYKKACDEYIKFNERGIK